MLQNMANLRCSLSNADYIYTNSYCTAPERSQTHKYSSRTIQTHNTAPERSQTHKYSSRTIQTHNTAPERSQTHNTAQEQSQTHNTAQEQSQTHNTAPKRYTIANTCPSYKIYSKLYMCQIQKHIYNPSKAPNSVGLLVPLGRLDLLGYPDLLVLATIIPKVIKHPNTTNIGICI